jgi:hypothetical protein
MVGRGVRTSRNTQAESFSKLGLLPFHSKRGEKLLTEPQANLELAHLLEDLSKSISLIEVPGGSDPYLRELLAMVLERRTQLELHPTESELTLDGLIYILSDLRFELTPSHKAYDSLSALIEAMQVRKAI